MDRIFLSYRRDDTAGYAGCLADALRDNLGNEVVFRDVDTIGPGIDFVQAITSAVENTSVLLAVIGRRWLTAKDSARRRRIDDPDDYVRLEITLALELGRKVIPILVDGARFPEPQDVPEPLRPLLRHNAIELSDTRWDYDVSVLLDELRPASLPMEEPAAPVENERGRATLPRRRVRLGVLSREPHAHTQAARRARAVPLLRPVHAASAGRPHDGRARRPRQAPVGGGRAARRLRDRPLAARCHRSRAVRDDLHGRPRPVPSARDRLVARRDHAADPHRPRPISA